MKTYLLTAFGVIFFSVIISFIIPKGKTSKLINLIIKIVCICSLIYPLKSLILDKDYNTFNIVDENYVCEAFSNNQSKELKILLQEKFDKNFDCSVVIVYENGEYKVEKVQVTINEKIYAYLQELGYINITVNDKTY